jgi:hypothetical protein
MDLHLAAYRSRPRYPVGYLISLGVRHQCKKPQVVRAAVGVS